MQGISSSITGEDLAYFLGINKKNAEEIDFLEDIMCIHDPQPIALIEVKREETEKKWIWRGSVPKFL